MMQMTLAIPLMLTVPLKVNSFQVTVIVYRTGKWSLYPCLSFLEESLYGAVIIVLNGGVDSCSVSPHGGCVAVVRTLDAA